MNSIKFIALIISILSLFCSCSNSTIEKESITVKSITKKVRAVWVVRSKYDGTYILVDSNIAIIDVDTMLRIGDVFTKGAAKYKIID